MEENKKEEILEIDAEQLEEFMDGMDIPDKLPPIVLSVDAYEQSEFQRGIDETSFLAGKITSLLNVGMSESSVLELLLSMETISHNIKVAEINKSMNIEISRNTKASTEKFEL